MEKLDEFQLWFVENFPNSWNDLVWRRTGYSVSLEQDQFGNLKDITVYSYGRNYKGSELLKLEAIARKKNAEGFKKSFSDLLNDNS